MKMVITIVQDKSSLDLIEALNEDGFRVTKLATTGGFLKEGNTTLMVGVDKEKVVDVIEITKRICSKREEIVVAEGNISGSIGTNMQYPVSVEIGGATIFVIDVDQFVRV